MSPAAMVAAVIVGFTVWLSFGVLAVVDAEGRRVGVLPHFWLLALTILIAGSVATALRLTWRASIPLSLSVLVLLPWLPLRVPDVFLIWAGPAVVLVWGGVAVSMLAGITTANAIQLPQLFSDARLAPRIAGLLAFSAFVCVRLAAVGPPGGDEPHYLLVAQSLVQDGDIIVANNYEREDYLEYWRGVLRPHYSRPGVDGNLYSGHAPGLPALIALAFAIGGYRGTVIWVALICALGAMFVWRAAYTLTRDAAAAWFGWAAVIISAPMLFHGTLIYPDAIASVLLAGGVLSVVSTREHWEDAPVAAGQTAHRRKRRLWYSFCASLPVALLPWLHTRLVLPAALLGLVLFLRLGTAIRSRAATGVVAAAFLTPILLSLGAWFAFFRLLYGTFNPSAPHWDHVPLSLNNIPIGLLGLLADQEFGLLPNAPVHILWVAGMASLYMRDRRLALELALIVGPYVIASSAFANWHAGASPPGRYLLPVVLPFGLAFAALWSRQDGRGRSLSFGLLALSMLIAAALAFGGEGNLAYNDGSGRARWLDWIAPLVDLPRAFPSYFRAAGSGGVPRASAIQVHLVTPAFVWAVSLVVGWILFRLLVPKISATVPLHAPLTWCGLFLVFGLGVTVNWSFGGGDHTTSTRSQLRFLRSDEPRRHSYGVLLPGVQVMPATVARTHLALSTSRFEDPPPNALLYLSDVPAGDYQLRVKRAPSAHGELSVGVGRATAAIWRGSLVGSSMDVLRFHLPVVASSLVVKGDAESLRFAERVALVPAAYHEQWSETTAVRARDGVRYGEVVVFTTDDRALLDAHGFWVLAGRQPEVVIHTEAPMDDLDLELRNVSVPNRVSLRARRWSAERMLSPDESWRVRVPVAGGGVPFRMRLRVESGLPLSKGLLGCRVEIR